MKGEQMNRSILLSLKNLFFSPKLSCYNGISRIPYSSSSIRNAICKRINTFSHSVIYNLLILILVAFSLEQVKVTSIVSVVSL